MAHQHRDVGRFDEWAPNYERHWMQRWIFNPVQQAVLDLAAEQVPQPKAILDVGCGTGRLLRAARLRFPDALLEGIDAAPEMIKQAQALIEPGSPIHFQVGTAENLPYPDRHFDLVFSTLTFHHWADQQKGAREVSGALAPDGRWLLADFIATGLVANVVSLFRARHFPQRASLEQMLSSAGMGILAERRVHRLGANLPVLAIGKESTR